VLALGVLQTGRAKPNLEPPLHVRKLIGPLIYAVLLQCRLIFTARRYAMRGLSHRNSVRPSVWLSVTLVDCVHMVRPTITISTTYGSPMILVSGDITFIPKSEGGHPERDC